MVNDNYKFILSVLEFDINGIILYIFLGFIFSYYNVPAHLLCPTLLCVASVHPYAMQFSIPLLICLHFFIISSISMNVLEQYPCENEQKFKGKLSDSHLQFY